MTNTSSSTVARQHAETLATLPFDDTEDFERASRGGLTPDTLGALGVDVDGDLGAVARLEALMDAPDPDLDIMTP